MAVNDMNLHQRVNKALLDMGDLTPDKTHPAFGFEYVSVQKLLAAWRKASIPNGIRTTTGIHDGELQLTFINVDKPEDRESYLWPVYEDDKGWSYTVKYALMKELLVSDDEPDENPPGRSAVPEKNYGECPACQEGIIIEGKTKAGDMYLTCNKRNYKDAKTCQFVIWGKGEGADRIQAILAAGNIADVEQRAPVAVPRQGGVLRGAVPVSPQDTPPSGDEQSGKLPWDE